MDSWRLTIILFPSHCTPSFWTLKCFVEAMGDVQSDTKKRELLKNPTKIEEI